MKQELIQQLVKYQISRQIAQAAVQVNKTDDIEILAQWCVSNGQTYLQNIKHNTNQKIEQQVQKKENKQKLMKNDENIMHANEHQSNKKQIIDYICSFQVQRQIAEAAIIINPDMNKQELMDWCIDHADDWKQKLYEAREKKNKMIQMQSNSPKLDNMPKNSEQQLVKQLQELGITQQIAKQTVKMYKNSNLNQLYNYAQALQKQQQQPNNKDIPNIQNPQLNPTMTEQQTKQKLKQILRKVRQIRKQNKPLQAQRRKQYLARYHSDQKIAVQMIKKELEEKRRKEQQVKKQAKQKQQKQLQQLAQQHKKEMQKLQKMHNQQSMQMVPNQNKNNEAQLTEEQQQKYQNVITQVKYLNVYKLGHRQQAKEAYSTIIKILNKIIQNYDGDDKYRSIKKQKLRFQLLQDGMNGQNILLSIGFVLKSQTYTLDKKSRTLEELKDILKVVTKLQNK